MEKHKKKTWKKKHGKKHGKHIKKKTWKRKVQRETKVSNVGIDWIRPMGIQWLF
jgi:hypothetical protein